MTMRWSYNPKLGRWYHPTSAVSDNGPNDPPAEIVGDGHAPLERRNAEPIEPRRVTAADLPCVHRREKVATIPCGLCGGRDRRVGVYVCTQFGACTINAVGRAEAQKVDGKFPATCLGCYARVEPLADL